MPTDFFLLEIRKKTDRAQSLSVRGGEYLTTDSVALTSCWQQQQGIFLRDAGLTVQNSALISLTLKIVLKYKKT